MRFGGAQSTGLEVKKVDSDPNSSNHIPMSYAYAQPQNFTGYIPQYTMMSYGNNGMIVGQE